MSEYAKNIQTIEDLWKKRIELPKLTEIVRCRDCRWYREEWNRKLMRDTIYCDWLDGAHVEPDGFCAWGERRGDAE